jgi:hypothetical protein
MLGPKVLIDSENRSVKNSFALFHRFKFHIGRPGQDHKVVVVRNGNRRGPCKMYLIFFRNMRLPTK